MKEAKLWLVGTPEQIAKAPGSYTGKYLKKFMKKMTFDISKISHSISSRNLFNERQRGEDNSTLVKQKISKIE